MSDKDRKWQTKKGPRVSLPSSSTLFSLRLLSSHDNDGFFISSQPSRFSYGSTLVDQFRKEIGERAPPKGGSPLTTT